MGAPCENSGSLGLLFESFPFYLHNGEKMYFLTPNENLPFLVLHILPNIPNDFPSMAQMCVCESFLHQYKFSFSNYSLLLPPFVCPLSFLLELHLHIGFSSHDTREGCTSWRKLFAREKFNEKFYRSTQSHIIFTQNITFNNNVRRLAMVQPTTATAK